MCSSNTDKFYLVNLAYLWSFCSLSKFFYKISCKTGVTTHQSDNEEAHYFSGTVYINNYEFVCIDQLTENKYMVYINDPSGHDNEQWVFGYYKTFARALNKAKTIVEKREYPKPIETW